MNGQLINSAIRICEVGISPAIRIPKRSAADPNVELRQSLAVTLTKVAEQRSTLLGKRSFGLDQRWLDH